MKFREYLDRFDRRLGKIEQYQAKHNIQLELHMKRSEAAERSLDLLRKEVEPLKKHVAMWAGIGKGITVAASVLGLLAAILRLAHAH